MTRVLAAFVVFLTLPILAACQPGWWEAREARDAYRECISRNPEDPSKCEVERLIYSRRIDRYKCNPVHRDCSKEPN